MSVDDTVTLDVPINIERRIRLPVIRCDKSGGVDGDPVVINIHIPFCILLVAIVVGGSHTVADYQILAII